MHVSLLYKWQLEAEYLERHAGVSIAVVDGAFYVVKKNCLKVLRIGMGSRSHYRFRFVERPGTRRRRRSL